MDLRFGYKLGLLGQFTGFWRIKGSWQF